jgi:hypothetical protein
VIGAASQIAGAGYSMARAAADRLHSPKEDGALRMIVSGRNTGRQQRVRDHD